jgi:hypothetical protein
MDYEKELKDPYITWFNGKPVGRLNERLAVAQGVTPDQLKELVNLHNQKLEIFKLMGETDDADDADELKKLAAQVEEVEFALQKNWNFTQDKNFHEWYLVPKCACPKMDNADNKGTPYGIRVQSH